MRRSFKRLVVSSVLAFWAAGFVVLWLFARSESWTVDEARSDGVFLAYHLLDETPAASRTDRLLKLRPHFAVELSLTTVGDVEQRVGRPVEAGERVPHRVSGLKHYFFQVFSDGQGALAAGPVNPSVPHGAVPIGLILAVIGLPTIAGWLAMRLERRLARVERASQALAAGDLGARVAGNVGSADELAANFNAMAERVEQLIRSRDELVQAVSHELGSPLSRMRFHMELLAAGPADAREERLEAMTRDLDALDELVAELMGYVQSANALPEPSTFDPQQGLADLVELARLEAPDGRELQFDLTLPAGTRVFADQRLFLRAVENLLRNAGQHAKGSVLLEVSVHDEHVRVAVHDDGPGIPEGRREKVLVPFVRLQVDRSRKTGGVGLGLAIVSRIVNQHGGRLEIDESSLGGACVATTWPKSTHWTRSPTTAS